MTLYINEDASVKIKTVTLNMGDDLFTKSNGREMYKEGYILNSINAEQGTLEFSGGLVLQEGAAQGDLNDEVLKFQIERTVQSHFEKIAKLKQARAARDQGFASLFFIYRVANYRD